MKEEWKVYIKGVQGRGEEVKQALINLEGKVIHNYSYGDSDSLFFINHYGEIRYAAETSEIAKIIRDNYREIKLPEKWKDGDILYNETNKEFAVVKYKCKFDSDVVVTYFVTCYGGYLTNKSIYTGNFRLATKSEIAQLYERLHSIGKDWDAKNKKLVNCRWKPKMGEGYFFIDSIGEIHLGTISSYNNKELFDFGNYFKTKEEAEAIAEKIKKLLNAKS